MRKKEYSFELDGSPLSAVFSDLAGRADGSVIVSHKDTVVLVTAVMAKEPREGADFLPLVVDYEEKYYASGRILGSRFSRREGKPSDKAVLIGRVVDRTIRPLFDQHIRHEIQVIVTSLSIGKGGVEALSVIGASLALATSDIPWNGPVSAAMIEEQDALRLLACGKDGTINMIECGASESSERSVSDALRLASEKIEKAQAFQKTVISEIGKPKRAVPAPDAPDEALKLFAEKIAPELERAAMTGEPGDAGIAALGERWRSLAKELLPREAASAAGAIYEEAVDSLMHAMALKGRRFDGRKRDELRPLFAEAGGISPAAHGSGVFYRGETHILSILTLGGPNDIMEAEGEEPGEEKRFMHHYNFPPFSTGDTGKAGAVNRRMIGHGALAEKALAPVIPSKEEFPYAIRIVSEALSSNGSTSMASVCGGTIALMDGGVPIKRPVAGISIGLAMKSADEYELLTDIQGPEDHYGDMDFKVAGTSLGITAIQMDVKVSGVPIAILEEALERAKTARASILGVIEKAISAPRPSISPNAPKIVRATIDTEAIGLVIGPGGKTVNGIKSATGALSIDVGDDGTVLITGRNGSADRAADMVLSLASRAHRV